MGGWKIDCCFDDTGTTEIYTLSLHEGLPIYFEPEEGDKVRVRVRLDGLLKSVDTTNSCKQIMSRLKVMADLDINEKGVALDGRIDASKHVQG